MDNAVKEMLLAAASLIRAATAAEDDGLPGSDARGACLCEGPCNACGKQSMYRYVDSQRFHPKNRYVCAHCGRCVDGTPAQAGQILGWRTSHEALAVINWDADHPPVGGYVLGMELPDD